MAASLGMLERSHSGLGGTGIWGDAASLLSHRSRARHVGWIRVFLGVVSAIISRARPVVDRGKDWVDAVAARVRAANRLSRIAAVVIRGPFFAGPVAPDVSIVWSTAFAGAGAIVLSGVWRLASELRRNRLRA